MSKFWILTLCEKLLTKSYCAHFFKFTFVCIFTRNMFSINHYVEVVMVVVVVVVQYFYQWFHYDNL